MTRVLLAPDKFKGTLTAAQVATHLGAGIRSVRPDAEIVVVPVSDGGDGLLDAATGAGFEPVPVRACGPTGEIGDTSYVRRGSEAVIEMAEICGLVLLPRGTLAPTAATSRGVGEVIAAALDAGCDQITVGIGGSASTDGGAGMLRALGARIVDRDGRDLEEGGGPLAGAAGVDLALLHPRLASAQLTVACDVDNPLTGPHGAAAVYAPQKGATPEQVAELDAALGRFADVLAEGTGHDLRDAPGAGAAGGVGFGAIAVLGARLQPGAEVVQELTGLEAAMAGADLVVTGEGSLDEQTLHGKAPAGVAAAARRAGLPVVAVTGRCLLDAATLRAAGIGAAYALVDLASYPEESFERPGPLLEQVGARIARHDMIGDVPTTAPTTAHAADLAVRARRAVVDGAEVACTVVVRQGRIVAVEPYDTAVEAAEIVDLADDEVLLPGLVDTHVHVNEPGRTEWEGFASATRAAAAGGVTTIIDMPLNSVPPTTTVEGLRAKQDVARDQIAVDVGFWGGAVPGNLGDLAPLHEAGVFGFKCFLIHSGVEEFAHLDADGFAAAMEEVARLGATMLVHAEDADQIDESRAVGVSYAGFLASRPPAAERTAVARVIEQAARTGTRTHLLHLSSAEPLGALREARDAGVDLSIETCPHYLVLDAGEIPDGATEFKCCPPIRDADNRDRLWAALTDGDIDLVVSDHSPSTPELKRAGGGDFSAAWGGIASLQVSLPAVWTAASARGHGLAEVVGWMAQAPADRVGLPAKGRLAAGADADLVVLAPDEEFDVDVTRLAHKNPVSAYAGRRLRGVVRRTWLRGTLVTVDSAPAGRLLERGHR